MTVDEIIALLDEPEKLVRRCYLHIVGSNERAPANGPANLATFEVEIGHQQVTGFTSGLSGLRGITKDRPFVKMKKQLGAATVPPPPGHFNAYYVPMVQVGDVNGNTSHYTLPMTAGAMMLTSKLSGCTFGVGSDAAGAVLVSHVQCSATAPSGSAALSTAVQAGMATVRGEVRKGTEYAELAAVIGRCNGTRWRFYMQTSDLQPNAVSDYDLMSSRRF